jgi:hypothetical protein
MKNYLLVAEYIRNAVKNESTLELQMKINLITISYVKVESLISHIDWKFSILLCCREFNHVTTLPKKFTSRLSVNFVLNW